MADRELHSITFPGLPDQYTVDYLARKDGVVDTADNLLADTAEDTEFTLRAEREVH